MANRTKTEPAFDENPEWTEEDFARARPASEVHGKEFAAAMIRPRPEGMSASIWAVVIANGDFGIREVFPGELVAPDVIAAHPTKESAELALDRVTAFHLASMDKLREPVEREAKLRSEILGLPDATKFPDVTKRHLVQSAEHEAELRNKHLSAIFMVAQPAKKSKD